MQYESTSDGEVSKLIYRSYDAAGTLIGTTTSLVRAKGWKGVAYVIDQHGHKAWPSDPENSDGA
jgi:hypothetical protein